MSLYCQICDVHTSSDVVMKTHLEGKKHQRHVEFQSRQRHQADKSVFIRGFRFGTDQKVIQQYFSQYGTVINVFLDREKGQYAIVEFSSKAAVDKVLSQRGHWLHNCRMTVKPRNIKNVKKTKKMSSSDVNSSSCPEDPVDHDAILSSLLKCSNVDEQMLLLEKSLRLTHSEQASRQQFCSQLTETFQRYFPGCEVHQFGSSVNGFGVRGCDMDLFLDLKLTDTLSQNSECMIAGLPYVGDIPSLCDRVRNGEVSLAEFASVAECEQIRVIGRMLSQCIPDCGQILTITTARCPVVKFTYQPSGLKCDLSINNRLALLNTRLLQLYSRLDSRLTTLVYTIRYWMKLKEAAGNPVTGPRLTNYAVSFLVIFYLQNMERPLLPTVETLASLADESEKRIIEGWDCSFSNDPTKVPSSGNSHNLQELLTGFFGFYSELTFHSLVVCPRTGKTIDIADFIESGNQQFKISNMNVQDPFVLEHNITTNVNEKTMNRLITEVRATYRKCLEDSFSKPASPGDSFGLCHLLCKPSTPMDADSAQISPSKADGDTNTSSQSMYEFSVILKHVSLTEAFLQKLKAFAGRDKDYREAWLAYTSDFIQQVFSKALLLDCSVVNEDNTSHCGHSDLADSNMVTHGDNAGPRANTSSQVKTGETSHESGSFMPHIDKSASPNVSKNPHSCESSSDIHQPCLANTDEETSIHADTSQDQPQKRTEIVKRTSPFKESDQQQCKKPKKDEEMDMTDAELATPIKQDSSDPAFLTQAASGSSGETRSTLVHDTEQTPTEMQTECDTLCDDIADSNSENKNRLPQNTELIDINKSSSKHGSNEDTVTTDTDTDQGCPPDTHGTTSHQLRCTSKYRVWVARKKTWKTLLAENSEELSNRELLDLESAISSAVTKQQEASKNDVIGFVATLNHQNSPSQTAIKLTFVPFAGAKEFSCFYMFLKTYLVKLVEKAVCDT